LQTRKNQSFRTSSWLSGASLAFASVPARQEELYGCTAPSSNRTRLLLVTAGQTRCSNRRATGDPPRSSGEAAETRAGLALLPPHVPRRHPGQTRYAGWLSSRGRTNGHGNGSSRHRWFRCHTHPTGRRARTAGDFRTSESDTLTVWALHLPAALPSVQCKGGPKPRRKLLDRLDGQATVRTGDDDFDGRCPGSSRASWSLSPTNWRT
jgi:hypothetical protein